MKIRTWTRWALAFALVATCGPALASEFQAGVARVKITPPQPFFDTETPFSPDGSLVPSSPNAFSSKWASGAFLSTAEDLVRFGSAHLDPPVSPQGAFRRPETVGNLLRPRSGLPPLAGYALGWITARDLRLRRVSLQFGAASGGTSVLVGYGVVLAAVAGTAVALRLARGRAAGRTALRRAMVKMRSCASREPAREDPL